MEGDNHLRVSKCHYESGRKRVRTSGDPRLLSHYLIIPSIITSHAFHHDLSIPSISSETSANDMNDSGSILFQGRSLSPSKTPLMCAHPTIGVLTTPLNMVPILIPMAPMPKQPEWIPRLGPFRIPFNSLMRRKPSRYLTMWT